MSAMLALATAELAGRTDLIPGLERGIAVPRCRCGSKAISRVVPSIENNAPHDYLSCVRCGAERHPKRWKR